MQGVVGFYDARDLTTCSSTCSWSPRAGFIGSLTGTASVSGDGWVMNPRMATAISTGIAGTQSFTSIVGFKLSSAGTDALRTLVQIGSFSQCRAQQLSASGLRYSGCVDSPADIEIMSAQQTASSHVWAVVHDGGKSARSYWNGAYFTHTTPSTWSTADGPLYVGRSAAGSSDQVLPGGVRFVLLLNRALTQSEVAAVARWSWESHGVGLDLMNFSPDAWTAPSLGQVYWTPPPHMQPLSSRTVRFLLRINQIGSPSNWRSIVRFGATSHSQMDRAPSVWIGNSRLQLCMTMSTSLNQICFNCGTGFAGPSFITVVFSRSSISMFINSLKQICTQTEESSSFQLSSEIADTDNTRQARNGQTDNPPESPEGLALRSLQLLDYAMPDLEAQAPVIISVTPRVLLPSSTFVTIIGSPFVTGAACIVLFLGGYMSTNCTAVSAVEILVAVNTSVPSIRPSLLLAVMHNGSTFRATVVCVAPYFVTGLSGSCEAVSAFGSLSLSNNLAAANFDDAAVKLNWPDSSTWVNSAATQPTYDAVDGSCICQAILYMYACIYMYASSNFSTRERVILMFKLKDSLSQLV
jgi:hypothetical protein